MLDLYGKDYIKSVKHEKTDEGVRAWATEKIAKMKLVSTIEQNWDTMFSPEMEDNILSSLAKKGMKFSSLKEIPKSDRKKAAGIVADVVIDSLKQNWPGH